MSTDYFGPTVRFCRLLVFPFEKEFGDIVDRIKRHSKIVDSTAMAIEMLRTAEFRKGEVMNLVSIRTLANELLEVLLRDQQNLKIQCHIWLKPPNIRAIHHSQVRARLEGTCDWIWQNPTFKEWNQLSPSPAPERLLYISGIHGCGKSVLASAIFEGLHQQTLFFSFSGTDTSRQSFSSFIRSCIWQLLQGTTDEKSLEIMRSLMLKGQPLVSELWASFKSIAALSSATVYCVIDGVDECYDPPQTFLDHILALLSAQANFRAVLLGRPQLLLAAMGPTVRMIEMNIDMTKPDIDAFIDAEIGKYEIFKVPKLRDMVVETLKEKSQGMFLWVKLMIDDLSKSHTLAQVKDRLRDLPRGLEKAYRLHLLRLVENLDAYELALARNVFTFTIASFRPLEVEELRHAHAIHSDSPAPFEERLLMQPDRRILDVCGGLVSITKGIARPIHLSLKEYLTRPEEEWIHNDDSKIMAFRVDLEPSHLSLGRICVDYLRMCNYDSPLSEQNDILELGIHYPLLKYASLYFFSHLNRSGPLCLATVQKIRDGVSSAGFASWFEYFSMLLLEEGWIFTVQPEFERFNSRLEEGGQSLEVWGDGIRTGIIRELENRTRKFGEHDPRTEQLQWFITLSQSERLDIEDIFNESESQDHVPESGSQALQVTSTKSPNLVDTHVGKDIFSEAESQDHVPEIGSQALQATSTKPPNLQDAHVGEGISSESESQDHVPETGSQALQATSTKLPNLANFISALRDNSKLPPFRYLDMLLKLSSHVRSLKALIDPLEMIFRIILQKASIIPVFVLLAIGIFYQSVHKLEQALKVFHVALDKVVNQETPIKVLILESIGEILQEQEKYDGAEDMFRRTIEVSERVLGKKHEFTLLSVSSLAAVLDIRGKYEEAEDLCRQVLETRQRVLRKDHKDTLSSAHNLAAVLNNRGKYEEAEDLCRQALETRQRVLRKDHEDTLSSAHILVIVLQNRGKYEEAEDLGRQAVETRQRVLRKDHKDTLSSVHDLATVLYIRGKYEEAEDLYRQVLETRQRVLRKDHKDTLSSAHGLAAVLYIRGKYEETEDLYRQALETRQRVLRKDHEDTLSSAHCLADVLYIQGKYEEAEDLDRQALETRQRVLRKDHEDTLSSAHNLAIVLNNRGKYEEAEDLGRQTLETRQRVLRKDHEDTLSSAHNLVIVLNNRRKYEEAEALGRQTLESRQRVLGKEHNATLDSAFQLVCVLRNEGKFGECEAILEKILEARKRVSGNEHIDTLKASYNVAALLKDQMRYGEAEDQFRATLGRQERLMGMEHRDAIYCAGGLASALRLQKKYEEAEVMYRQVLESAQRVLGKEHRDTGKVRFWLADVLRHQGKYKEAEAISADA
jgi:tetratricopeptide (TPR) repeat protein